MLCGILQAQREYISYINKILFKIKTAESTLNSSSAVFIHTLYKSTTVISISVFAKIRQLLSASV